VTAKLKFLADINPIFSDISKIYYSFPVVLAQNTVCFGSHLNQTYIFYSKINSLPLVLSLPQQNKTKNKKNIKIMK